MPDASWIAGFLDGEGSIMIHGRGTGVAMRVTASNTHRPTLDAFCALTGIGAVIWNAKKASAKHKPSGWWLVNADGAESVLRQVLPYMRTKRRQAELAIAFQARLRDPALKADRTWQHEYLTRMQALNRRGPQ